MSNQIVNEFRSIRKFAYILIAMGLIGRATGPVELASWCGITPKTAKEGLKFLELSGHVYRIKAQNGWLMTSNGQLFLTPNREILPVSPTTTMLINSNNKLIKELKVEAPKDGENLPVSESDPEYSKWLALKGARVGEPSRSKLARMDITLEYVEAHIKQWRLDKKPVGLLIHRIRELDPVPEFSSYADGLFICKECFQHPCDCEED